MTMYQEIDPFHNIPRQQIVRNKIERSKKGHYVLLGLLTLCFVGILLWGKWVEEVVPEQYIFDPQADAEDTARTPDL
jgi:hypothetical protein